MVMLVTGMGVAGCTVSEDEARQTEQGIASAPIEVRVSAVQLYDDYVANKLAANQKYDGKVLLVTGIIEDLGGGNDKAFYLDLATSDFTLVPIRCHFAQSHLDDLTSLSKGDRVTLRGKGDEEKDRDPFTIDVLGCSLEEHESGVGPAIQKYNGLVRDADNAMGEVEHWSERYSSKLEEYSSLREKHEILFSNAGQYTEGVKVRLLEYSKGHKDYEQLVEDRERLSKEYSQVLEQRDKLFAQEDYLQSIQRAEALLPIIEQLREVNWQLQIDIGDLIWQLETIDRIIQEETT